MADILKAVRPMQSTNKSEPTTNDTARTDGAVDPSAVSPTGWVSPKYSRSRTVSLDWHVVEANRCVGLLPGDAIGDHYKMLRTQINQRMQENGWRTLMVTSLHAGEGSTLTAINLAGVFAKEYQRTVLLVDADLNQQSIHRKLGYESDRGLADYLLDDAAMPDIIAWPQVEKLAIISGGRHFQEGAEVLNSPRMQHLVQEMKNRYTDRYVIFDVPALLEVPYALAFSALVDAVLIVVAKHRTPMPDVQRAMSLLPKEKIAGFVMNRD